MPVNNYYGHLFIKSCADTDCDPDNGVSVCVFILDIDIVRHPADFLFRNEKGPEKMFGPFLIAGCPCETPGRKLVKYFIDMINIFYHKEIMNTNNTTMHPLLEGYLAMLDFLAAVMGENAEIVLHDVSHMDNSVVAIRNGHVSGRKIGAPTTDLALKLIKSGKYSERDFVANYKGLSAEGKALRSATYFIRDDRKKLIGMLCINIDTSQFEKFRDFLNGFIEFPERSVGVDDAEEESMVETFSSSVEALAFESINSVLKERNISPERMSQSEKVEVIGELNNSGVFLLKGAVSEVAARLKVSEPTVYRYLSKIKKKGK